MPVKLGTRLTRHRIQKKQDQANIFISLNESESQLAPSAVAAGPGVSLPAALRRLIMSHINSEISAHASHGA